MTSFVRKLRFVHERLWRDDEIYRIALLAGPAPILGMAMACVIWGGLLGVRKLTETPPPWATPPASRDWNSSAEHPQVMAPSAPLPPVDGNGNFVGFQPGWLVGIRPIDVDRTMDVNIRPESLSAFVMNGPVIDVDQINAAGPKSSLFAAVGLGFLVVKQAGIYALSAELDRDPGPAVNCVVRLGFGPHRVTSHVTVNIVSGSNRYDTAWFDLQPGLYSTGWALGCWHGSIVAGSGRMTILIRGPGDADLRPATPKDFVRQTKPRSE